MCYNSQVLSCFSLSMGISCVVPCTCELTLLIHSIMCVITGLEFPILSGIKFPGIAGLKFLQKLIFPYFRLFDVYNIFIQKTRCYLHFSPHILIK